MLEFGAIALVVLVYTAIVARLQPVFSRTAAARCVNCSKGVPYRLSGYDGLILPGEKHDGTGFALALFWPLTAPYALINANYDPSIKRGKQAIEAFWEQHEEDERAKQLAALEKRAGL